MMKWMARAMTVTLLATLVGCTTTTSRTHPDMAQQLKAIHRVVIAPPEIEVTLLTFTGEDERQTEVEDSIRREVLAITRRELEEGGYEVVDFDFEAAKQHDEELAFHITEFVTGYENAKEELRQGEQISPAEAASIRVSLGEAATRVAAAAEADAVLLVRFGGFEKSGGQVAKDVGTSVLIGVLSMGTVIPVQPRSGAYTEVALVDGYTGDVLWTDVRAGQLSSEVTDVVLDQLPNDVPDVVTTTDPVPDPAAEAMRDAGADAETGENADTKTDSAADKTADAPPRRL